MQNFISVFFLHKYKRQKFHSYVVSQHVYGFVAGHVKFWMVLRSALFWVTALRVMIISYQRSGMVC